jgi:hypothetical protein
MIASARRRLASLLAVLVLANAVLSPVAEAHLRAFAHPHAASDAAPAASTEVPPCHESASGSHEPTSPDPASPPCCDGAHCVCMVVPTALTFAKDTTVQHQPAPTSVIARAQSAAPRLHVESPFRPPNA